MSLLSLLVTLLILALVFGLIYWIVSILPLPAPFKNIALVIVAVIGLIYLLSLLFGGASFPVINLQ